MKKETFVNMINAIIDQIEKERKITETMESFLDGNFIIDITSEFINTILKSLEIEMQDPCINDKHGSLISWWLWDAPEAGKCKDSAWIELESGKRITLETPEQLYDYLKMNHKQMEDSFLIQELINEHMDNNIPLNIYYQTHSEYDKASNGKYYSTKDKPYSIVIKTSHKTIKVVY